MNGFDRISAEHLLSHMSAGIGVFHIKDKLELLYINEAAAALSGRTARELMEYKDADMLDLVDPRDVVRLKKELQAAVDTKGNIVSSIRIFHKDNTKLWVKIIGGYYCDLEGFPVYYGTFIDISKEKCLEEKLIYRKECLKQQLKLDKMTGLFNRDEMVRIVDGYFDENPNKHAAFLMIDIDNFKRINDTYGHMQGDEVLGMIAKRLQRVFRKGDKIARMGGDEFTVFIPEVLSVEEVAKRAESLCRTLNILVDFGNVSRPISCSVGIALAPEHGRNFKTLYKNADIAQYEAKQNGKNRAKIFGNENVLNSHQFEPYGKQYAGEEAFKDDFSRLQVLVHSMPAGVAVYELEDTLKALFFNDEILKYCGYSREEYCNTIAQDAMAMVYETDRKALWHEIQSAVEQSRNIFCNYRIMHKSGSICWVQMTAVLIKYRNGNPVFYAVYVDMTKNREELEAARYRADHDALTGIYNRERFFAAARQMLDKHPDRKYVLIRTDIYRFKILNELLGRRTGDSILKAVAGQIKEQAPGGCVYGRFGGDDFVILLPEEELVLEQLEKNAENLIRKLNFDLNIVCYIGIYRVEDKNEPMELMCDRAQMALRKIKGDYLVRCAFYDESLRESVITEQEVLADMSHVLEKEELVIYYQPVYNAVTGKIFGAEALVRWMHPVKGILPPDTFIPFFEQNGFIQEMDRYVWRKVCGYLSERKKEGKRLFPVSVNVSRINMYNRNFPEEMEAFVRTYDLDPKYLRLEITESAYMADEQQLLSMTDRLRKYGFVVLMDDFGTGYSSLTMLKDIPVDVLKLDRQFICDIGTSKAAEKVIAAIIQVAQMLGIGMVAEGVESEEQCRFLKQAGCTAIQGYYFSRPVPLERFLELLEQCGIEEV